MIYADTSLLFAVYQKRDAFHNPALKLVRRLQQPIALTSLSELELLTNVYRGLAAGIIDRAEHDAILRQISEDIHEEILMQKTVDETDLYRGARELAKRYVPEIPLRSLDILHVVSAQLLSSAYFLTFEKRQHSLARKLGLSVLP